jgi:WD40 repeat protein
LKDADSLFSTSYDGTVRRFSLAKGEASFELVFTLPSDLHDDDIWLQHTTLSPCGNLLFACASDGHAMCVDLRSKKEVWRHIVHDKKVNTVDLNQRDTNYLCTSSLDRSVKIFDVRKFAGLVGGKVKAVVEMLDSRSVNCALFSPTGSMVLSVGQSNYLRVYDEPHKKSGLIPATGHANSPKNVPHNNQTGRYLPVFHAQWDPKTDHAFVVGSMMQPRQVEVYSAQPGRACHRVMSLQEPEWMASVQSRNAFHPGLDAVVCGNASGRAHIFR